MEDLIQKYGYVALFFGAIFEGETFAILGGFAVHQGYLSALATFGATFTGTLVGDQFFFQLGRLKGREYLRRRIAWQMKIQRVTGFLDSHENWLLLGYRFMYGFRTLVPFALGLANVSRVKFVCFNLAGALVWSSAMLLAGYLFGQVLTQWLGELKRHEPVIVVSVLSVSALIWLTRLAVIRHRIRTRPLPPTSESGRA
jgi:membrane protein DedA with SNARE-associated domain